MKTEKRLTMALSVLVALMMLAVPLASSSNLFVDGGQTNSNGDAPLLGADAPGEGYTITLLLNGNENSLDKATYTLDAGKTWYLDEDGNLYTVVDKGDTLSAVFADLYSDVDNSSNIKKTGYDLDSWKDEATGAVYGSDAAADNTEITSNMTFSAQWLLKDTYCEIPVIVDYKGEQKEYVKAYPYLADSDDKKITIAKDDSLLTNGVPDLDTYGIVVNAITKEATEAAPATIGALSKPVYSFKATYGDNKEFEFTGEEGSKTATISADSKITITYTFDKDNYSEIVVSSIAFKDGKDVTLYADRNRVYTYPQVYTALTTDVHDGTNAHVIKAAITIDNTEDKVITTEGYELTGWNEGAEPLSSEKEASSPLTLDAKLNGYYVIFMSKGQFEYVYVPFGELKADKTTLDIDGVNHWVYITYDDYITAFTNANIKSFNFASTQNVNAVESEANGKTPAAVLIACFTPTGSTSYAVFDANIYKEDLGAIDIPGNFGNEYVTKIIIPGKAGDATPLPSSNPVYDNEDSKILFLGWDRLASNSNAPNDKPGMYASTDKYGEKNSVNGYVANAKPYEHVLSFYVDGEISAKLYYNGTLAVDSKGEVPIENLVAFEYEGMIYAADIANVDKAVKALQPEKDGYSFTQWNDKDGKKVFSVSVSYDQNGKPKILFETGDGYPKDGVKTDMDFYAQFDAKTYTIKYINAFGGEQTQKVKVDQNVTLYGKGTFFQEGYELAGWSTVPGAGGDEYKLEGTFVLNGADYEKLASASSDGKTVVIELYSIWEFGGVTPGDNTEGGNNTALYLIAGMLLVIAVLGIAGLFLLRRKN